MTNTVDVLLASYERGTMNRREFLLAIAALSTPVGGAAEQPVVGVLSARTLHHVNLQVSDVARSAAYYQHLFGFPSARPLSGNAFGVDLPGAPHTHISLQKSDSPGRLAHFCIGVQGFNVSRVTAALEEAGLDKGLRAAGNSVYVQDPDGIRVQIAPFDGEV
jgi:catechol 2,3-dioxygenase-like lactoylglutathione lyase family enzyme